MERLSSSNQNSQSNPNSQPGQTNPAQTNPAQNGSINRPTDDSQTAETLLRSVTQDLRILQQDLLTQLNQDISRLQAEKSRLLNDIEKLQTQQQTLQSQHEIDLSRQQLAQQQAWAKQLALVLANHLQTALNERLNQSLGAYQGNLPQVTGASNSDQSYRLAASLDETVNRTFASLRHDINSYQSSLAQQLERMHTLGQQGEAILEVLVKRLSQQLQVEARSQGSQRPLDANFPPREISPPANLAMPPEPTFSLGTPRPVTPPPTPAPAAPTSHWTDSLAASATSRINEQPFGVIEPEPEPEEVPVARAGRSRRAISVKTGLGLVLLSAVVMSLHYVVVGIIGNSGRLFGQQAIGGYLSLDTFSNSALLLWIRMLVVVPIMVGLSTYLHPPTLREVRAFSRSKDRRALWGVIGSGVFLFLSQVLLYIAIGQMGPAVAIAILFIYPVGSLLLGWLLFAEKLTFNRIGMIVAILLGAVLAIYPLLMVQNPSLGGIIAGLLSALTFTFYLISMQIGARKLHPIPVSLIQFATLFVLSSFSLIVLGIKEQPTNWTQLMIGGVILGVLTAGSYALNHFGIRAIGAARAAIIAASTPILTALLAFFLVPGELTTLKLVQIVGILIVTLGGTAVSLERMTLQNKALRQAKMREEARAQEGG
jgi:drug/metabolite transporter (DMT)-like permease